MEQAIIANPSIIGQVFAELKQEGWFLSAMLSIAIALGILILIVVKIIHRIVSGRHTKLTGMVGLDEEEKKDRTMRQKKKELEQAIKDHDDAIQKYQEMRNLIRTLSDGGGR